MTKYIIIMLLIATAAFSREINVKRYLKYSVKYESIIKQAALKYEMDTNLIQAVISWESNWSHKATSNKNCVGMMQINKGSKDPKKNIMSGCGILRNLFDIYRNKEPILSETMIWKKALSAYNMGYSGFNKYHKRTGKEHYSYADNVFRAMDKIKNLRNTNRGLI